MNSNCPTHESDENYSRTQMSHSGTRTTQFMDQKCPTHKKKFIHKQDICET